LFTAPIEGVLRGQLKSIEREGEVRLRRVGPLALKIDLLAEFKCNQ
jgi:hypothetical protein